jgi:hypothetical protein
MRWRRWLDDPDLVAVAAVVANLLLAAIVLAIVLLK